MKFNMEEYMATVGECISNCYTWRYGQILFNVLDSLYPDLADQVRGTEVDPFYANRGDERINLFFNWLIYETER